MEWLSVAEAASKLELSQPHVRRLLRNGALGSERVGKSWLVSAAAVRERQHGNYQAGRPVSASMAWSFLWLLEQARDPQRPDEQSLASTVDRKQRYRLRRMMEHAPVPEVWSFWLRRRAEPHRYWVHPAVLPKIDKDPRLRPSGGDQIVGNSESPVRRLYLDAKDLKALVREHRAQVDPAGQVVLMAIPESVPEVLRPPADAPLPNVVALVDLLDSVDAREKHAAVAGLSKLLAKARPSS